MITSNSNQQDFKPRKPRKLGDLEIIKGMNESKFWGLLFTKPEQAILMMLGHFIKANSVALTYCLTSVIRIKPGQNVSGQILGLYCLSIMLAFNSIHIWIIFTPFVALSVPLLPIWIETDNLYRLIFVEIHSQVLLIYAGIFTLTSLTHSVLNWTGKGNKSASKRGESLLYLLTDKLLSDYVKVNEFFILMLETIIVMVIGIYLWTYGHDVYFGGFLVLISSNELVLLLVDQAYRAHVRTIINS